MFTRMLLAGCGLCAAFVVPPWEVHAQTAAMPIVMADGRPAPRAFDLIHVPELIEPLTKRPWRVWVACEGFIPLSKPALNAAPARGAKPLKFMQETWLAALVQNGEAADPLQPYPSVDNPELAWAELPTKDQDPDHPRALESSFLLLADAKGQPLGWGPREFLVLRPTALKDSNTIYLKHLLINRADSLRTNPDENDLVPVLPAPQAQTQPRESYRLLNILFEYGRSKDYILVGNAPSIGDVVTTRKSPEEFVRGWVRRDRSLEWRSRRSLEWSSASDRQTPGRVFLDEEDARRSAPNATPFIIEPWDVSSRRPIPPFLETPRYPVLKRPDDAGSKTPKPNPYTAPGTGNAVYYVAGVGQYVEEQRVLLNENQLAELRERIRKAREQLQRQKILIVMDRTTSMTPHFEGVKAFIKSMMENLRSSNRPTELSVCYYDDTDVGGTGGEQVPMRDLRVNYDLIIDEIDKQTPVKSKDAPELMFKGIADAIHGSGLFDDGLARKIVILIGDCPNKPENGPTADDVARLLAPQGPGKVPAEFHAIQIYDPDHGRNGNVFAFKTQVSAIHSRMRTLSGDDDVGSYTTLGLIVDNENKPVDKETIAPYVRKLTEQLRTRYELIQRSAAEQEKQLWEAETGRLGAMTPDARKLLAQYVKLSEKELDALVNRKGRQICQSGYVLKYEPGYAPGDPKEVRQTREMLLLSAGDVAELLRILNFLFKEESEESSPQARIAAVKRAIAAASGDPNSTASLAEIIKKQIGLEVNTPLLHAKGNDLRLKPDEWDKVRNCWMRLKDLTKREDGTGRSLKHEWKATAEKKGTEQRLIYTAVRATHEMRFFKFPGLDVEYCWIDVESEMP